MTTETPTVPVEIVDETSSTELTAIVQQNSLQPDTARSLTDSFAPAFKQAKGILEKSRAITVTSADQKLEMKIARECRLGLKAVRVSADKLRKELKDESLRKGRAIDGFYNILVHLTETEETRLREQEEFVERQEAARKAQLKAEREESLRPFGIDTAFYSLGEMSVEAWTQLFDGTVAAHKAKEEARKRAEEEKIAREKAEAEERERIRQENERLKREAAEKEEAAKLERERVAKEKAEAEARAKAERDRMALREAALGEIQGIKHQVMIALGGRSGARKGGTLECIDETLAETEAWLISEASFGDLIDVARKEKEAAVTSIKEQRRQFVERAEAEAKARAEREESERKLAEERAKAAAERKAAEEAARVAYEKIQREQAEAAAKAKAEHEAFEAKMLAERKAADEKARKEREAEFAKLKAEREAREKLEREVAERRAQEEAVKKAEAEAAKKAAAAPDREKVVELASKFRAFRGLNLTTDAGKLLAEKIDGQINKFAAWLEKEATGL